jgi:hypothetical protein
MGCRVRAKACSEVSDLNMRASKLLFKDKEKKLHHENKSFEIHFWIISFQAQKMKRY